MSASGPAAVPLAPPSVVDITARPAGPPADVTTYVDVTGAAGSVGTAPVAPSPPPPPAGAVGAAPVAPSPSPPPAGAVGAAPVAPSPSPPLLPPVDPMVATPVLPRTARRARHRRRRRWLAWSSAAVAVLVLAAAGWVAAQRIGRPSPPTTVTAAAHPSLTVPGSAPSLPWPILGQGAVSVPALGYSAQSGPESSVPIASLTKMTNAVVILRDHPLAAGTSGPTITVTAADVAQYDLELHEDQSTVPIRVGEVLTERQMLEAMLTQSANDVAYSLAVWDAGTLPAFVAEMNALAASLGASSTHYVDASGYDPGSVSTASDCLRIAAAGMGDPAFAEIVGMKSITLPIVGTIPNIVTEIGTNNVVGIKSGYTSAAGGCMVLAADRQVGGRTVLVIVAVLGQPVPPPIAPTTTTTTTRAPGGGAPTTTTTSTVPPSDLNVPDPFRYTRPAVEHLLDATESGLVPVTVATQGQPVGVAAAYWGGATHRAAVVAADGAWMVGWPGLRVAASTVFGPVPPDATGGTRIGTTTYLLGTQLEAVPLRLARTVPQPSWWWRLVHG